MGEGGCYWASIQVALALKYYVVRILINSCPSQGHRIGLISKPENNDDMIFHDRQGVLSKRLW